MLVATLGAFAEANLSLKHAAARLHVHPNTLSYRLQRVEDATGLNPRRFAHLRALLVAVEVKEPNRGGLGAALYGLMQDDYPLHAAARAAARALRVRRFAGRHADGHRPGPVGVRRAGRAGRPAERGPE